jgi:hypothetical protein
MISSLKGPFKFITELKNPNTIVIKNKFYPSGLKESEVHNYYIRNKNNILKEVKDREVMLFLKTENHIVVRRKDHDGNICRLTSNNYEDLIHGRILSIHSTMNQNEMIGIVDIDINDFSKAKKATADVYDYLKRLGEFKDIEIRYTGKESFHIFIHLRTSYQIDRTRLYLKQLLTNKFLGKYDIEGKRKIDRVNLDLSPNKHRGGFITLGSLSIWGLKCIEVFRSRLTSFNPSQAKIK